mmetsp:Transcript_2662/g.5663  ORF Transcript_2662/g.5663 Transcript_2662/m.5663 type:complete len:108 (-) Transcript_2662:490-813(-)
MICMATVGASMVEFDAISTVGLVACVSVVMSAILSQTIGPAEAAVCDVGLVESVALMVVGFGWDVSSGHFGMCLAAVYEKSRELGLSLTELDAVMHHNYLRESLDSK